MQQWTYALLLLASIAVPLIRSFEPRIFFIGNWKALLAGIFVMMLVFIPWDVAFTKHGVWGFSHEYVSGLYVFGLPIEEWMFFIVITYCVVFSYEVIRYFFPRISFPKTAMWTSLIVGAGLLVAGLLNTDKVYTFIVTMLAGALMILMPILKYHKTWLSHYLVTYLITLIPFFIVNGVLTRIPVVWYNNAENLGIRLTSIPVEDSAYFMAMMLIVMPIYERLKPKK
ncbi:MAG: lycopene cyclase domain-containing protein [Bacteroides sp.]|jgi:lycopene cyclase domain-containing protein|nr:lycopene cyclase domain-containing protein [Bacteroides sp.]